MQNTIFRIVKKLLKISGISIAVLLLLLYLLPILFPGTIGHKVKSFANQQLKGEVGFSTLRLSFFSHFPTFTVSLYDFTLKGSAPFVNDTLVAAKEVALGINLQSLLFNKKIHIDKIFLDKANLNIQVNKNGEANYNVYKGDTTNTSSEDTAATALKLEMISISNSHLRYNDESLPMQLDAQGFNYKGKGDLSKAIFDLKSTIAAEAFSFRFDGEQYLSNKKLNAELITQINTRSLSFIFSKNNIKLNKLPIVFNGRLDFLSNGYNVYFSAGSPTCTLEQLASILPPQYAGWQQQTNLKGNVNVYLKCSGKYIAASQTMPSLQFNMQVRDGFIAYNNAPAPISNLNLMAEVKMPNLNADSLQVHVTPLSFSMGSDFLTARLHTSGSINPYIDADVQAKLDLGNLDRALGILPFDIKGQSTVSLTAKGRYVTGPDPNSVRHENTVLAIPVFNFKADISNGYFKYDSLPQAISNITSKINIACPDGNFLHTTLVADQINATALDNFVKGRIKIDGLENINLDADFATHINLAAIRQMIPMDKLELAGMLDVAVNTKGNYEPDRHLFPTTVADITLKDGSIKTRYYPNAISQIQVQARAVNTGTSLQTQSLTLKPVSFLFEGEPFKLQAQLSNFENINYNLQADGRLDLGRIYQVFQKDSLDISGVAEMHLNLKGTQQAALKQQYHLLHNQGSLALHNIKVRTALLPHALLIKEGRFKLVNDKMWFNQFLANYGSSDIALNGYLQDAIGWYLTPGATLKGKLLVESKNFDADEWMVYADTTKQVNAAKTADSGVVVVPQNMDVELNVLARQLQFNGIKANNAKATVKIKNGTLLLEQTGMELAGSQTLLNASYKNIGLDKAVFEMDIDASEFDIKRMYDSVKLFRDMASAAAHSKGVVSLQYKLKGRLGNGMQPVYPSLDGEGVLKVKDVKVKGFKLFNAVSRNTGKDSIANPNVREVNIRSRIRNNVITLERFRIRSNGFRLRIEGQSSFDGALRLRMRLGLPPLGIFGIPMNVSGTTDNPRIRLGKGSTDALEEKEDEEQVPVPANENRLR